MKKWRDSTVLVLGEDVGQMPCFIATKDLYKKIWRNQAPVCSDQENSFTGMAVGVAMTGLRPIIEGMNMGFCSLPLTKSPITLEQRYLRR